MKDCQNSLNPEECFPLERKQPPHQTMRAIASPTRHFRSVSEPIHDSSSDKALVEKNECLLEWANNERRHLSQKWRLNHFEQLEHSAFTFELLSYLNPQFFGSLSGLQFEFSSYFQRMEAYLFEFEGKRLRRLHRRAIVQSQTIVTFLPLLLHLLVGSAQKNTFIWRIFELGESTQKCLMKELKYVAESLENILQVKQIVQTVEQLQEENEALRQRLRHVHQINKQLEQRVVEAEEQRQQVQEECDEYAVEKQLVLERLSIVSISDYIDIYKQLYQEHSEIAAELAHVKAANHDTQVENAELKQRIKADSILISHLHQRIVTTKRQYHSQKEDWQSYEPLYELPPGSPHGLFPTTRRLKQNPNFNNINKAKQTSALYCVQDGRVTSGLNYQDYQSILKEVQRLSQEIEAMRRDRKNFEKRQQNNQRKLERIREEHERFAAAFQETRMK